MRKNSLPSPSQIIHGLLLSLIVVVGIVLLPVGTNALETTKSLALLIVAVVMAVVGTYAYWTKKSDSSISFTLHPIWLSLGILVAATLLSTLFGHAHPLAQLIGFGGTWLGFFMLVYVGGALLTKPSSLHLATILGTTGAILAILQLGEIAGLKISSLYSTLLGVSVGQGVGFSPIGSLFILIQFCALACVACALAIRYFPEKRPTFLPLLALNGLGLLLGIWFTLPGKEATPVILPWSASWSITIDSLRDFKTAFIGMGPDTFVDAFTTYKPLWMNTTPWWNVEFTQSSSLVLSILSTHGLLGLAGWFLLTFTVLKRAQFFWNHAPIATGLTVTGLLLTWFVPPTTSLLTIWGVCLAFLIAETKHLYPTWAEHQTAPSFIPLSVWRVIQTVFQRIWPFGSHTHVATKILSGVGLSLLTLGVTAFTGLALLTEIKLFQANKETLNGNIVQLYENQKSAITMYPYNDTARRQYALTNLAIASAVSNKADLSEEDGQRIAILVQQAIREAKASVLINPYRAQSWETLGDIYTNFIGIMDNSDALALESYRQAIAYSPANPSLYIKLGGVFYRQGNYTDALVAFEQAARSKPDLANAYYNAANTLKQLNDFERATNAYKQTLLVLERTTGTSSEEYLKANLELEELQQNQTASASSSVNSAETDQ